MDERDIPNEEIEKEYSKQWTPIYGLIRSLYKGFKSEPSLTMDPCKSSKYGLFCAFHLYHGAIAAIIYITASTGLELLIDSLK